MGWDRGKGECIYPNCAVGAKRPFKSEQMVQKFISPYQSSLEFARLPRLERCLAATDRTVILASIPLLFSNCWEIILSPPPPKRRTLHLEGKVKEVGADVPCTRDSRLCLRTREPGKCHC